MVLTRQIGALIWQGSAAGPLFQKRNFFQEQDGNVRFQVSFSHEKIRRFCFPFCAVIAAGMVGVDQQCKS